MSGEIPEQIDVPDEELLAGEPVGDVLPSVEDFNLLATLPDIEINSKIDEHLREIEASREQQEKVEARLNAGQEALQRDFPTAELTPGDTYICRILETPDGRFLINYNGQWSEAQGTGDTGAFIQELENGHVKHVGEDRTGGTIEFLLSTDPTPEGTVYVYGSQEYNAIENEEATVDNSPESDYIHWDRLEQPEIIEQQNIPTEHDQVQKVEQVYQQENVTQADTQRNFDSSDESLPQDSVKSEIEIARGEEFVQHPPEVVHNEITSNNENSVTRVQLEINDIAREDLVSNLFSTELPTVVDRQEDPVTIHEEPAASQKETIDFPNTPKVEKPVITGQSVLQPEAKNEKTLPEFEENIISHQLTSPTEKQIETNADIEQVITIENAPAIQLPVVEDQLVSHEPVGEAPDSILEIPVIQEELKAPVLETMSDIVATDEKPVERQTRVIQVDQELLITHQTPENVMMLESPLTEPGVASTELTGIEVVVEVSPETNEAQSIETILEDVRENVVGTEEHELLSSKGQKTTEARVTMTPIEATHLPLVEALTVIEVRPVMVGEVGERSPENVPLIEFFADQPIVVEHLQTLVAAPLEPAAVVLPGEVAPDGEVLDATVLRAKEGEITYEFRANPVPSKQLSEPVERQAFANYAWVAPEAGVSTVSSRGVEIIVGTPSEMSQELARGDVEVGTVAERPLVNRIDITATPVAVVETELNRQWPRFFPATVFDDTPDAAASTRIKRARIRAQRAVT